MSYFNSSILNCHGQLVLVIEWLEHEYSGLKRIYEKVFLIQFVPADRDPKSN